MKKYIFLAFVCIHIRINIYVHTELIYILYMQILLDARNIFICVAVFAISFLSKHKSAIRYICLHILLSYIGHSSVTRFGDNKGKIHRQNRIPADININPDFFLYTQSCKSIFRAFNDPSY